MIIRFKKLRRMNFIRVCFIFVLVISWFFLGPGIKQALAATAPSFFGAVTTNISSANRNTVTFSHTVATGASNRLLIVNSHHETANVTVSSITYAGQSLTLAAQNPTPNAGANTEVWYLVNPAEGANDVVVNWSGNVNGDVVSVLQYQDVDQTSPIGATNSGEATTGLPYSITLLTTVADALIFSATTGKGGDTSPMAQAQPAGNTERFDLNSGTSRWSDVGAAGGDVSAATVTTYTIEWTPGSDDDWALVAVELKPVPTILSISVSPLTWGVGTVDTATTQMSTSGNKIGVTNDGNVAETFTLQIYDEDDRDEWTHSSLKTGAGNNIYVLSGIFCATTDSPTETSFNETDSEDVLTTTQQTATSTKFAYTGGSADAVAVPVSGERSLWLRLDMPTVVSGTYAYEQHTVTVRISCQQS